MNTHTGRPSERRLRVCLIATHFAEYSYALAKSLAQTAEVMVIADETNTQMEIGAGFIQDGFEGIPSHLLRHSRNPFSIAFQALALVRAVRRFEPDVIHVQEATADVLALALRFLPQRPLVLTMHDPRPHQGIDSFVRERTRRRFYVAALRRRADAVIVHGESLLADAAEALGARAVAIQAIPHGPLGQRWADSDSQPPEPGRCLFFGRIEEYKGLDTFIDVIDRLRRRGIEVTGVVAGRGTALTRWRATLLENQYYELIDKFLTPAEAVQQFQRAEVIVLPYREATQSGVSALAMGVGRPIVAYDVGALSESVSNNSTGLLAPPGDLEAMVNAVQRVLSDSDLRQRLGEEALARGNGDFAWSSIAGQHLAAYRNVMHRRRPL